MRIKIKVKASIELADGTPDPLPNDPLYHRMRESAVEAVRNALSKGELDGFTHDLDTITSLEIIAVDA